MKRFLLLGLFVQSIALYSQNLYAPGGLVGNFGGPHVQIQSTGSSNYGVSLLLYQVDVGNSDGPKISLYKPMASSSKFWGIGISNGVNVPDFTINEDGYHGGFGTPRFIIKSGGDVGIGHAPVAGYKLAIGGKAIMEEVNVKLQANWPDYVFEKSYALPSLEAVKSYIDENKHLPEVPGAKDMEQKGINVGEMNMLLLKKVEEMTLYLLQQNSRIDNLTKELTLLKKELKK